MFRINGVVLAICVLFCVIPATVGVKCVTCASKGLRRYWHLTGFPVMPPDELFLDDNANPCGAKVTDQASKPDQPKQKVADCSSFCVIMQMPQLDDKGNIIPSSQWYLRGCHSELMGDDLDFNIKMAADKEPVCVVGSITTYNNDSKEVEKFDVTFAACTKADTAGASESRVMCNSDVPSTCPPPDSGLSCVKSLNGQSGGTCDKAGFCFKFDSNVNGRGDTVRGCSPYNPYFPKGTTYERKSGTSPDKPSVCVNTKVNYFIPTRSSALYWSRKCYCNDRNSCNGAERSISTSISLLFVFVCLGVTKFFL